MEETKFVCPFCGREYKSKLGLSKHLKKCESKPDEEEHAEMPENTDTGIGLFDDDDEEEGDTYECPDCGYTAKQEFGKCPECGVMLEW